ncbi:MAG: hypothetical protein ABIG44_02510 [Planctomycetota bacterium]
MPYRTQDRESFVKRVFWLSLILSALGAHPLYAQPVVGDVAMVGFRASRTSGTGYLAREGQWIPIQARLTVQGSQMFQGQLSFETADLDGDLIAFRESPVTVTPDAGLKRAWCYAAWQQTPYTMSRTRKLDIISADGVLINQLTVPEVDFISNDTMLILDISDERLTHLRGLFETPNWRPRDPGCGVRPYYRNIAVAAMPAADLPDRWFGLEAVDVVLWDRPNPAALSNAQMEALTSWVRRGGQLVVGIGQNWPAIRDSALAEIIPLQSQPATAGAESVPASVETNSMPRFFGELVEDAYQTSVPPPERTFRSPVVVTTAEAKPGALRAFKTMIAGNITIDLITIQWIGSGRVIAVAASLRDLTRVPVNDKFYAHLFDLNTLSDNFRNSEGETFNYTLFDSTSLYSEVVSPTSFGGWGSLLVLAAFAFVVVYIGLATLVSWWWLKQHSLVSLSWTVFAVFAVVASVLSLGTVTVLRGVQRGVHAFSLVDLEAGRPEARARCYFGYRSPIRRSINLTLAGDGSYLRPMTRDPQGAGVYATPQRYSAIANRALLEATPMRATLKQFEGFWEGTVDGKIQAALTANKGSGEITLGSWIYNDLNVDLTGGYLIYVDPRFDMYDQRRGPDFPTRPAGATNTWGERENVPPALNILVAWIPPIRSGEKLSGIGQEHYRLVRPARARWDQQAERSWADMPDLQTLWDEQNIWLGAGQRRRPQQGLDRGWQRQLDATAKAALLASTRNFHLHSQEDFDKVSGNPISTDGLMNCDITSWLMQGRVRAPVGQRDDLVQGQGQAVLLLMADDPGPVRLQGGGNELSPVSGHTMYRVRVPLNFEGNAPRPPEGITP